METARIRGAKVLLPSDDEAPVASWPHPNPLEEERVANTDFRSVDLSSHRLVDVRLDRCRFRTSRLMGTSLVRVSLRDVVFEGCQFDYATWAQVRTVSDVAFVGCSFKEAEFEGCDLREAVFDDCTFGVDLRGTSLTGADLRESDLSGLSGLASLRGAKVTAMQLRQLSEVMVRDLNLTVAEAPL
ncbi:pentapeptide repeat-containing protein [Nocardiopsis quinghaiensis]|uniref:pentapeptide repeat-containing protein n=1 Tax=Nocardiopsis quinghaiensis TaxID=464995 RepID=UPI00123AB427|nr:pentapeptide repeat-containing protein [Nocardiopsis quinghaiensis]